MWIITVYSPYHVALWHPNTLAMHIHHAIPLYARQYALDVYERALGKVCLQLDMTAGHMWEESCTCGCIAVYVTCLNGYFTHSGQQYENSGVNPF